jgi:hypothetical protein
MVSEIHYQVLAWKRHKKEAGLKLVNDNPTLYLLIIDSPTAIQIQVFGPAQKKHSFLTKQF